MVLRSDEYVAYWIMISKQTHFHLNSLSQFSVQVPIWVTEDKCISFKTTYFVSSLFS